MDLGSLAENAERLSRRIQESFQERTRDLTRSTTASYLDAPDLDRTANLSKLLDSNSEREKLDGMKRIIAASVDLVVPGMISKNRNVSMYFAQVVKNVASPNLEIRKLVYIFLLRYAGSEPDLALLSINTFQKDLTDSNPLIRAMALRVLSGIPVSSIGSIVVQSIKRCAADSSPYVRKAAALAIPKCYKLSLIGTAYTTHLPSLMQTLSSLLRDRSPVAIGSVVVAFNTICPDQLELLHQHYRRLCRMIVDVDEWGQVHLLDLLGRYARKMLAKPASDLTSDEVPDEERTEQGQVDIDVDLQLLFKSAAPLFQSRNPAVVMAVTRTFYHLGPRREQAKIVPPLLRILHSSKEVERVVLENLFVIAKDAPELLRPHTQRLYIRALDIAPVKRAKLRILVTLITPDNAQALLREFKAWNLFLEMWGKDYVVDTDDALVSDAVWAIGQCARIAPDTADACLTALTMLVRSSNDAAVAAAVLALKTLHRRHVSSGLEDARLLTESRSVVARLASHFDTIKNPEARACILWMVGQYCWRSSDGPIEGMPPDLSGIEPWAPDVLRKAAKEFISSARAPPPLFLRFQADQTRHLFLQPSNVKLQTLTLAAKVFAIVPNHETTRLLARYVFSLGRYDLDYDVRDRSRFLSSLLIGVSGGVYRDAGDEEQVEFHEGVILRVEQVRHVLFEGKTTKEEDERWSSRFNTLGTVSLVVDREMPGDYLRAFPDWPDEGTDPSLRDTEDDVPPTPFYPQATSKFAGIGSLSLGPPMHSSSASPSPIILTPGGASPAGSAPRPGFVAPKQQFMDLEEFFKSDEEEEGESDEEGNEEAQPDGEVHPGGHHLQISGSPSTSQTPPIPTQVQKVPAPPVLTRTPDTPEAGSEEEYTESDEEDEEDAFLRRG
ncbi:AP-3 complex subunit beta [Tulasnella sp. 403]|nr:AP-3 complex subunit beta [Tulasnella sp. 403]